MLQLLHKSMKSAIVILSNRDSMVQELPPNGSEFEGLLSGLSLAARDLASAAANATPDQFPGLEVTCTEDGRAAFTWYHSKSSTARYNRLAVFHGSDGSLCIEEEVQRPSMEDEGLGHHVRITTTYPLSPSQLSMLDGATTIKRMGKLYNDGTLFVEDKHRRTEFGQAVDEAMCQRLLARVQEVSNAQFAEQSPAPRHRWYGWFSRLLDRIIFRD